MASARTRTFERTGFFFSGPIGGTSITRSTGPASRCSSRGVRPRLQSIDAHDAIELPAALAPIDEAVDARRILDRCEKAVEDSLTPLQRRIFQLKHLRQQPIRAIAQALGKSEDAIKANLYRMRRSIAEGAPGLDSVLRT